MSTFGEASQVGGLAALAAGGDQHQRSMSQFSSLLGKPKCFSGREDKWHDWSGATAATLSDHASMWMSGALKLGADITLDLPGQAAARIFARQMKTLLIQNATLEYNRTSIAPQKEEVQVAELISRSEGSVCEGRALAIVRGAPDHHDLEAWRLVHEWYQPKTRSRGSALMNEILGWDFGSKEQFLQRMKDLENATLEYNRTSIAPQKEEVLVAELISRSPAMTQLV